MPSQGGWGHGSSVPRALTDRCPASPQPPPPATPWWRSTSAGAWARTTRSPSRRPIRCPSRAPWTTTLPKPWVIRGFRSRRPRTAHPAAPSQPRAGASLPAPPRTWSATATPPPWSREGSATWNKMSICMVCLSFEQSVLKKRKNKTKKKLWGWGGGKGREGMVYSQKPCRWDFCSVFVLAWYSSLGALRHDRGSCTWNI